jgi:hypothetical protein
MQIQSSRVRRQSETTRLELTRPTNLFCANAALAPLIADRWLPAFAKDYGLAG